MVRNNLILLLLLPIPLLLSACSEPQSTSGDDDDEVILSGTVQADYRINYLAITKDKDEALDINGDGNPDNNLDSALSEVADFMINYLADYIPSAAMPAVKTILNNVMDVDTINIALVDAIEQDPWITRVLPPTGEGPSTSDINAQVEYWIATQELGDTSYTLSEHMGSQYGAYDEETTVVDVDGDSMAISLTLTVQGSVYSFDFTLRENRTRYHFREDEVNDGQLAGAIPVTALDQLIVLVLDSLESYLPAGQNLDELTNDVHELLMSEDVSDILITNGDGTTERGVSTSFVFTALPSSVVEY